LILSYLFSPTGNTSSYNQYEGVKVKKIGLLRLDVVKVIVRSGDYKRF